MSRFRSSNVRAPASPNGFPNLSEKENWYRLPLLCTAEDPTKPLSYERQASAISSMLKAIGVETSKATHIGRTSGARLAEEAGVEAEEIAKHGKWSHSVMADTYLRGFSVPTMLGVAGFKPQGHDYHLPRDVPVPEELKKMIWPELDM